MKIAGFLFALAIIFCVGYSAYALAPEIPSPKTVGAPLALTIEENGDTIVEGARITQITGSTIFASQHWGMLPVRWIIRTDAKTSLKHRFGNPIVLAQFALGHFISVEGVFNGSSDSLGVDAKSIKNWSVSTEGSSFAGTVASAPDQSGAFILQIGDGSTVFIKPKATSTVIRGIVAIPPSAIALGDRVLETTGVYNHLDRSLSADSVKIFQDKQKFSSRNFEGKLTRLDSVTLPTVAAVVVNGKEFTVYLPEKTLILRKDKAKTTLQRFVAGDIVRFYGAIREAEWSVVDAEVLRTLEF
ncbi:MAG: hypothetical protein G01um101417_39 [Parcubacteria group bacterium Gr01-1014_17]|nr:MAG: hypothetical protein G01um101417_39 [Parcubacteria group bacterium Gr01-1014_17]